MNQEQEITQLLDHHLNALLSTNVPEILSDYDDDSLIYTPNGPVQGLSNLKIMFASFLANLPADVLQSIEVLRQDIYQDTAYILWRAGDQIPLGTDTFVIRNCKIAIQSFAAQLNF